MKINEFDKIVGCKYIIGSTSDDVVNLSTDSRNIVESNTFLALRGDNFDGYSYINSIISNDMKCIIFEDFEGRRKQIQELAKKYPHLLFVAVENSLLYLQDCASYWIRKWQSEFNGKVLALTGSNGKTTTKEILFSFARKVLNEKVICTKGNFNNHIGVPLTILSIKEEHKFAIVEMGTNHPGEIEVLCKIANPDYGLITNIGAAHIEFLGSEKGVLQEKGALYRYIISNGEKFYLNMSDEYLSTLEKSKKVIEFSTDLSEAGLSNSSINESFNRANLNFSYKIIRDLFPQYTSKLDENYSEIKLPENKRSQWIVSKNTKIYLDAYNANPSSMKASLESFILNDRIDINRAVFICGDMNELGKDTASYHEEIGKFLRLNKVKNVVFVGKYSEFYIKGFGQNCEQFKTTSDLSENWTAYKKKYDFIFLKASRSLQLESLIDITD